MVVGRVVESELRPQYAKVIWELGVFWAYEALASQGLDWVKGLGWLSWQLGLMRVVGRKV